MRRWLVRINVFDPDSRLSGMEEECEHHALTAEEAVMGAVSERIIRIAKTQADRPEFTPLPMIGVSVSLADPEESL